VRQKRVCRHPEPLVEQGEGDFKRTSVQWISLEPARGPGTVLAKDPGLERQIAALKQALESAFGIRDNNSRTSRRTKRMSPEMVERYRGNAGPRRDLPGDWAARR